MIENGEFERNPVLLDAMKTGPHRRPATALVRAAVGWRRALAPEPSLCAAAHGQAERRGARLRALLHGRARYAAHQRRKLHRAVAAEDARIQHRAGRQRQRALLRHGSRQEVGPREEGLRRDGLRRRRRWPLHRRGAGREGLVQPRRDRRIHHPFRSHRRPRRAGGHHSRWRCLHQLQLPRRPRAADHALPWPQQPLHAAGWPRTGRLGRTRPHHPARPRAQRTDLHLHDALRQELHACRWSRRRSR